MRKWVMFSSTQNNEINKKNLYRTIFNEISIQECYDEGLLTDVEKNDLTKVFPTGYFHCWGTHDGDTKKQFDKIEINDFVLASNGDYADISGKVVYVMRRENSKLGSKLWDSSEWKWIFFIAAIKIVTIPLDNVQSLIGYYNYTVQGLNVKEHNNVEHVIAYVEGKKTWDDVKKFIVTPNNARKKISLDSSRAYINKNGEEIILTYDQIIKSCRKNLHENNIKSNANNIYDYLEGTLDGVINHKKIYYGKGAGITKERFVKLYIKYKGIHKII